MERILRGYVPHGALTDFLLDTMIFAVALFVGASFNRLQPAASPDGVHAVVFLLLGALLAATNAAFGLYRNDRKVSGPAVVRAIVGCAVTTMALFLAGPALAAGAGAARSEGALLAWALGFALIRPGLYVLRGAGVGVRRVLIVGTGPEAIAIHQDLQQRNERDTRVVGFFEAGPVDEAVFSSAVVFRKEGAGLWDVVKRWRIHEVIVAVRQQRGGVLPLRDLLECRINGVRVLDETANFERLRGEFPIESLKASWLIYAQGFEQGWARTVAKRVFDIAGSLGLLAVFFPVMALAALAIALESSGPVIFRQERVGRGGRTFNVLKFRSMRQDAEKDGVARWATARDPRITRVGRVIRKARIDELPQLINVLRGDMSLVGPRPERPGFVEQLRTGIRFYDVRHSVKPGVTGWAQIRYRYAASLEDSKRKLQFDLYYVKNHSLWLDLRILLETVRVVLRGEGAQ